MPRKRKPQARAYPVRQLPHMLNMPLNEIKRLIDEGEIQVARIGQTTLVTRQELRRLLTVKKNANETGSSDATENGSERGDR